MDERRNDGATSIAPTIEDHELSQEPTLENQAQEKHIDEESLEDHEDWSSTPRPY
jgi:hypothetical protein